MKQAICGALCAVLTLLLLPAAASASEYCVAQMGGVCRDACGPDEGPEVGAFEDCGEKQECCVKRSPASAPQAPEALPEGNGPASGEGEPRPSEQDR